MLGIWRPQVGDGEGLPQRLRLRLAVAASQQRGKASVWEESAAEDGGAIVEEEGRFAAGSMMPL